MRTALNDLLSPDATEAGVDLSRLHEVLVRDFSVHEAQQKLWELSELSFHYELIMLDQRAIPLASEIEDNKEYKAS